MSRAGLILHGGLHQGEGIVRLRSIELRGNRDHFDAFYLHVGEFIDHVYVDSDIVHQGFECGLKLSAGYVVLEVDEVHGVVRSLRIVATRSWLRGLLRGGLLSVLAGHVLSVFDLLTSEGALMRTRFVKET